MKDIAYLVLGLVLGLILGIGIYWLPLGQNINEWRALWNLVRFKCKRGDEVTVRAGADLALVGALGNNPIFQPTERKMLVWHDEGIGWFHTGSRGWLRTRILHVSEDGNGGRVYRISHRDVLEAPKRTLWLYLTVSALAVLYVFVARPILGVMHLPGGGYSKASESQIVLHESAKAACHFREQLGRFPSFDEWKTHGPIPELNKIPKDAWGKELIYYSDGSHFSLRSLGRDQAPGGTWNDSDIEISDSFCSEK